MDIREIAEQLEQSLIERPNETPSKLRQGAELKFVRRFLSDWGYKLPEKKIKDLAAKSQSYDGFIRSATTFKIPSA
jgi:hypothetical protein